MAVVTENQSDGMDGLPVWAKAVVRVGLPTAMAGILLWFLLTGVTANLKSIADDVRVSRETMQQHSTMSNIDLTQLRTYLRMICVNTSKNDSDRSQCLTN